MTAAIIALAIIFIGALVQATVGFGFALIAMPLLPFLMDISASAALIAFGALFLSGVMLFQQRAEIRFDESAGLIGAALVGIPFGVVLLSIAPRPLMLFGLGIVVMGFSAFMLAAPQLQTAIPRRWRFLFGFIGGVLGGAYNTSGPAVVLYGALRQWSPPRFLMITQSFFAPTSVMICVGHGLAGRWSQEVMILFAISAPLIIFATIIGRRLNAKLPTKAFSKIVYACCIGLGAVICLVNLPA